MDTPFLLPNPTLPSTDSAPSLNWGILGPGWIAQLFAESMNRFTTSKVAAVGSRDLARAEEFVRTHGDAQTQAYGDYSAVINDPRVQVIYIAVPHSGHHQLALQAIAAGKHVLVEKSFALNAVQARQMADAAMTAGVFAMEAMWTRLLPSGQLIRQVLDSGLLGQIRSVQADYGKQFEVDPSSRFFDPALGGGALLDLGVYTVAFSAMVSPAEHVAHVSGRLTDTGVDATFNAILVNQDGSVSSLFNSIEVQSPNRAWIAGSAGTLEVEAPAFSTPRIVLRNAQGEVADARDFAEFDHQHGLAWEVAHVARCISEGLTQSPVIPLEETVAIARTMDQISAALRN